MIEGKPSVCPTCGSANRNIRNPVKYEYGWDACGDGFHDGDSSPVPAATREIPEEEVDERIQPCGHFAYRAYYDSPTDYGCGGCDNEMEPDALVSAPQAESAPDAEKWMRQLGFLIGPWNNAVATKYAVISWMNGYAKVYAASETAALRAERDHYAEIAKFKETEALELYDRNETLEREIKELRAQQ